MTMFRFAWLQWNHPLAETTAGPQSELIDQDIGEPVTGPESGPVASAVAPHSPRFYHLPKKQRRGFGRFIRQCCGLCQSRKNGGFIYKLRHSFALSQVFLRARRRNSGTLGACLPPNANAVRRRAIHFTQGTKPAIRHI